MASDTSRRLRGMGAHVASHLHGKRIALLLHRLVQLYKGLLRTAVGLGLQAERLPLICHRLESGARLRVQLC